MNRYRHRRGVVNRYRRRRGGVTLVEALIGVLLFVLVMTMALGLWRGAFRGFFKGQDAVSSAQEASIILMHLRRDLGGMCFGPPPGDWEAGRLSTASPGAGSRAVFFDDKAQTVTSKTGIAFTALTAAPASRLEIRLFVHQKAGVAPSEIVYVHDSATRTLERREGGKVKRLSDGRVQRFDLTLMARLVPVASPGAGPGPSPGPGAGASTIDLFADPPVAGSSFRQCWWRLRLSLKSDDGKRPVPTTKVAIETRIFPKNLNRRMRALWQERR